MVLKPIVVVGSINMDLVTTVATMPRAGETLIGQSFATHPGGKGANQAVAAARLGQQVKMIGMLGDDDFGRALRDGLEKNGVDHSGVGVCPGGSGVASIIVDAKGENCIVVVPGSNFEVTPEYLDSQIDTLRSAGVVLAQLEIPLESIVHLAEICVRQGVLFMLDPAPAQELPAGLFPLVDWFTPNETEAEFYVNGSKSSPEVAAKGLLAKGCKGVVLKRGAHGVLISRDGATHEVRSYQVNAIDTTAAGDCFNGVFAAGLNGGMSAEAAADLASKAAAISVTRRGAQPSMPTMDEVSQLLS